VCNTQKQIDRGSLVAVELVPALVRPLGVIYNRQGGGNFRGKVVREFTPAVQAFLDFLLQQVGQSGEGDATTMSPNTELQGVGTA
jgi:hypothetical protein